MKKATQNKTFKLLSLVLTLAMIFAVATIPTLTASAGEVVYVTNKIVDFEEGKLPSAWSSGTSSAWSVKEAPAELAQYGTYSIFHKYTSSNATLSLNDFDLKAERTYRITIRYCYMPTPVGDDGNPLASSHWMGIGYYQANDDGTETWKTNFATIDDQSVSTWKTKTIDWTPSVNVSRIVINASKTDVYFDEICIVDVTDKVTNTQQKQVYNFESNKFSTTLPAKASIVATKGVDGGTGALEFYSQSAAAVDYNAKLDVALTQGKYYKLSFKFKGAAGLRILPNSGGWGSSYSMYGAETIGTDTDHYLVSEDWKTHEIIFSAKYDSTHFWLRPNLSSNVSFYLDDIVVEEYEPGYSSTIDFDNMYFNYFGYTIEKDTYNAENNVLKFSGTSYNPFYIPNFRLTAGKTYYLTFDYKATTTTEKNLTGSFAIDARTIANVSDAYRLSRDFVTPINIGEWETAKCTITPTSDAILSLYCQSEVYFDNFTICEVTDKLYNTESLNYDFTTEEQHLLGSSAYINVDSVVDETLGRNVLKINYSNHDKNVSKNDTIRVPFVLESGKTYIIKLKYRSDVWSSFGWKDSTSISAYPLSVKNTWTEETRYVTGTDDMPYFFMNGEGNIYVSELSITPAGELNDVNGDGELNARDITLMRNRVLWARDDSKMFEKYADNNSDGWVDIRDLVTLNNRTK